MHLSAFGEGGSSLSREKSKSSPLVGGVVSPPITLDLLLFFFSIFCIISNLSWKWYLQKFFLLNHQSEHCIC